MTGACLVVGIDIGGTFTDVFCLNPATGEARAIKTPTTWPDPAEGLLAGLLQAVPDLRHVAAVIHGTTIATNAVLERKGAPVALITTRGFRDVVEMRRRQRPQTYGLKGNFVPLVPRHLRFEVDERISADGSMVTALDEEGLRKVLQAVRAQRVEAVAVCFINAFANPVNEERAHAIIAAEWPQAYVSIATRILPEIKEFERCSTTVLNALVQPVIDRYLGNVERQLLDHGYAGQLSIVQSNGGIASVSATRNKPVTTMLSGPAAGVTGANAIARQAGFSDIVTFDMGGTSLDAAVVLGNQPYVTSEASLDFGVVVKVPMIDITTIGAGGGSIVKVTTGNFLQVGPESAGSTPGPVCYGRGGTQATVTDANLILGRINAQQPIGGVTKRFDIEAARAAVRAQVAEPLGLDLLHAAEAIVRMANTRMANAVRLVTVEKGLDPRRFTLVAFGGGGPLHAAAVTREVGIPRALIPLYPGLTSAIGCAIGNVQYDFVQSVGSHVDAQGLARTHAVWDRQRESGLQLLDSSARFTVSTQIAYAAEMQYEGQTHTLLVPFGKRPASHEEILEIFRARYKDTFGLNLNLPARVISAKTSVIGVRAEVDMQRFGTSNALEEYAKSPPTRFVWVGGSLREVPVHHRSTLRRGTVFTGPAVIEQADCTVLVECGMRASVDALWNLILEEQ